MQWNAPLTWGWAVLVFFAPDLSFLAYLRGPRLGAVVYNLLHLYALGAALIALGLLFNYAALLPVGALLLAHCGFDRMLGYGLKSGPGFGHTHLGRIGAEVP